MAAEKQGSYSEYGLILSNFVGFTETGLKLGYTSPIATNKGF